MENLNEFKLTGKLKYLLKDSFVLEIDTNDPQAEWFEKFRDSDNLIEIQMSGEGVLPKLFMCESDDTRGFFKKFDKENTELEVWGSFSNDVPVASYARFILLDKRNFVIRPNKYANEFIKMENNSPTVTPDICEATRFERRLDGIKTIEKFKSELDWTYAEVVNI